MGSKEIANSKQILPDSVQSILQNRSNKLEDKIEELLKTDNPLLSQIASYICINKGKRIRPVFLFLCSSLTGYRGDEDIFFSSIIEFIHAATLLHDDVIDQAALRRGIPSANSKWGDRFPILVGDYLFAKSFFWLVEQNKPQIMSAVSSATASVTNGEILQLQKMGRMDVDEVLYLKIISKKTASLISACCKIGGLLGGASVSQLEALSEFGMCVGSAFQLIDDILDFNADEKRLGKPVVNDFKEGNCTLPLIYSLGKAYKEERKEVEKMSKKGLLDNNNIKWLLSFVKKYKGAQYTFDKARALITEAKEKLSNFDKSESRQALLDLADYIIAREY